MNVAHRRVLQRLAVAAFAAIVSFSAAATPVEEAQVLIQQGDLNGALQKLDSYLARSPQDAEARFTRGLVLVRLNRTKEAIKVFSDLTRDYPQLPEPYNNLAVLYAQQGDYEKARDALEAALATHPSYATAHENLGDVYAALAGAAYNKALSLDKSNQQVRYKLSLINQLSKAPETSTAAATPPSEAPVPETTTTVTASTPPTPELSGSASGKRSTPEPAVTPPPAASTPTLDKAAIEKTVELWAQAWSAHDVEGYLSFYSPDFTPEGGLTHDTWVEQRHDRVGKSSPISVQLSDINVTPVDATHVRVDFQQKYASDNIKDQVHKVLEMVDSGDGGWKITREYLLAK